VLTGDGAGAATVAFAGAGAAGVGAAGFAGAGAGAAVVFARVTGFFAVVCANAAAGKVNQTIVVRAIRFMRFT
jgi:hypothetical protein